MLDCVVRAACRLLFAAATRGSSPRALRALLRIEADLQLRIDGAAIAYDGGVHPKHRLTGYHDFFADRIRPGERVLDVGCGIGALAHDLAARSGARVTGIDVDPGRLRFARERYRHELLDFVEADALDYRPAERFDVVVLSNVLEHLGPRVELLRRLATATGASRFLIRVPLLTRHWHVPLRRELGLPHLSDATHELEYEPATLEAELAKAGLAVAELRVEWGEIWAVAQPAGDSG